VSQFHPFTIEVDGRRYSGDWCLMQGGRICVRSDAGYGSEIVEIVQGDPDLAAQRALKGIVVVHKEGQAAALKRQERELAKLRRRRKKASDNESSDSA
jgi:hypothetical protein